MAKVSIFWFRRDLRLDDNAALYHALRSGTPVVPVFIFDTCILNDLANKTDKRVDLIRQALVSLQQKLENTGSTLHILHGTPLSCFHELAETYAIQAVYTNHDYEPYAQQRDQEVKAWLLTRGITLHSYKDQVIFEKDEISKDDRSPYQVFTPYARRWKEKLSDFYLKPYPTERYLIHLYRQDPRPVPSLKDIGFADTGYRLHLPELDEQVAIHYHETRDIPSINGTTRLSAHLRFGTISIRKLAARVRLLNETLLNELIWREFYQMILWHFPHTISNSFKPEYDRIPWRNDASEMERWREGKTGYPIVDAGMRELNETGWMHNRVRMITASFLCKHLLIDWRRGEAYFAEKLLDYDLASNNGGWQWCAGSGCDAAPYFRVFNPYMQTQKFDPQLKYINQWIPELNSFSYPRPMIAHETARKRCLDTYAVALKKQ